MKIEAFNHSDVGLIESIFRTRFDINRNYLLSLDSDSLLFPFRSEAVLHHWSYHNTVKDHLPHSLRSFTHADLSGEPYGGWEHPTCTQRGNFLGHYLSACARIYAISRDHEIKKKSDYIIEELAKCQQQNGNGYICPIPEKFFDIIESGRRGDIWLTPYYVSHKVLMGLYEMYKFAGNTKAFLIMKGMVGYIKRRVDRITDEWMQKVLDIEFGGMPEVLYDFYGETGEQQHLLLARKFEHRRILEPLAKNQDFLTDAHGNTNVPKIHGAARAYELTGKPEYKDIAVNFWEIISKTRTFATGGSTGPTPIHPRGEHWGEPNLLKATLSEPDQETCVTYNWLRLCRYLLRWTGDAKYGDMYERALLNGIISIQNPSNGMFAYFTPLKTGSSKNFGTPTDSFWCCYGTGVQAFADLTSSIYFYDDESVYVNLFIPSEVCWSHSAVVIKIKQENNYPEEPSTKLTIQTSDGPVSFGLKIRIPWWVRKGVETKVNREKTVGDFVPGTFCELKRAWKNGDIVEVHMPMSLYAEPINDDPNLVAVMYGPLVMAGLTSHEVEFKGDKVDLEGWIESASEGPLVFQTKGQTTNVKFIPLYKVVSENYGVYFTVT